MCENEKKVLPQALEDNELDQVAGGADNDIYLDEERPPLGWLVTCYDCGTRFYVSEGKCPKCLSTHVRMTY